uniref:NADH-ubiquinone oxidoreductase chain 6 n=1 Tax=Geotrypetes seraphini TaxID=260995 RepID=C8UZT1_GEOSA|nr:NADH dehydrogenase subunit 6 [Geotrypetes seraphini]AAX58659.1 NADH dehydrogenase subunit 6 [Geotrypetes seraphini]
MFYLSFLGFFGFIIGMVGVASNPSPYFAAYGLVMGAMAGCWLLVTFGLTFLSLVLLLIYLGGMLVVFAYSAAMAADQYPMAWDDWSVFIYVMIYWILLLIGWSYVEELDVISLFENLSYVRCDWGGVMMLYYLGGFMLLLLGWVLLVTLFVVLEITRYISFGNILKL